MTMLTPDALELYTVYAHPSDYPDKYVVRRTLISRVGQFVDHVPTAVVDTLAAARAAVPPQLHCIPRQYGENHVIVEVWV